MSRQSRACWLATATAAVVVGFSAMFAIARNTGSATPASTAAPVTGADARLAVGRAAFQRLNCMNCHSVAGKGNPANPLDGVGVRLDAQGLRDWTLGQGGAAGKLSAGAKRQKAPAANDPDLPALLDYLASLK